MAIEDTQDRPPYVMFEMRGVEDRNLSIAAGHIVEKEVAIAIITRPGSRDTLEKEATGWIAELRSKKSPWFSAVQTAYDLWVKGETGAVDGTPIKGWSMLGSAAQKTLLAAGIMTIEDLAACPDQDLTHVGTGAIAFKVKAKAYLEAANGPGKQAERLVAIETQMAALVELTKNQAKEIERLRAFEPKKETAKA